MLISRVLVSIIVMALWADGASAQSRTARAAACFKLVKAQSYGAQYKQGWLGACGAPSIGSETREYAENSDPNDDVTPNRIAQHKFIGSDAECRAPLGHVPVATLPKCGMGAGFIDTFAASVIRIPLPGGKCAHALPLLLTEKTGGFYCNALRARVACLQDVRQESDRTVVRLSVSRDRKSISEELTITPDQRPEQPLFSHTRGRPMFALIPAQFKNYGKTRDTVPFIADQVDKIEKQCLSERGASARSHCREQVAFHAERLVQEQLRRAWAPREWLTQSEKKTDQTAFLSKVRSSALGGSNSSDKRALFETIVVNEIGNSSPYQVLDAVSDFSGPSWGAHQIDIGANSQFEIDLFWRVLSDNVRPEQTPGLSLAQKFKQCISAPIRHYYLEPLAVYYRTLPLVNNILRTENSRAVYDDRFKTWLAEEVSKVRKFGGLFSKSLFARLFYLDVDNQYGSPGSSAVRSAGRKYSDRDLASCTDIEEAEQDLVDAHANARSDKKQDIERRSKTLMAYIARAFPESHGREKCAE